MKTFFKSFIHLMMITSMLAICENCKKADNGEHYLGGEEYRFYKSYIDFFASASSLIGYKNTSPATTVTKNRCFLRLQGNVVSDEKYEELIEQYGDTCYNQYDIKWRGSFSDEFISIDVKSNRSFDKDHPAGSSLADIAIFRVITLYNYIKSGYEQVLDDEGFLWPSAPIIVEKRLNQFTSDELKLLETETVPLRTDPMGLILLPDNPMISFDFSVPPPTGSHTLTVIFKTVDGKTLSTSFYVDFYKETFDY